ncbi:hypothetical protein [Coxiella burnetii]|uniref:hypothetical protein n=1 Tax=Coxiella burnetii TaxID=777 RepID=UPI0021ADDC87|nr:hypothetical protein [Coxiella burnetii]
MKISVQSIEKERDHYYKITFAITEDTSKDRGKEIQQFLLYQRLIPIENALIEPPNQIDCRLYNYNYEAGIPRPKAVSDLEKWKKNLNTKLNFFFLKKSIIRNSINDEMKASPKQLSSIRSKQSMFKRRFTDFRPRDSKGRLKKLPQN